MTQIWFTSLFVARYHRALRVSILRTDAKNQQNICCRCKTTVSSLKMFAYYTRVVHIVRLVVPRQRGKIDTASLSQDTWSREARESHHTFLVQTMTEAHSLDS